jgi:hypothetical protein
MDLWVHFDVADGVNPGATEAVLVLYLAGRGLELARGPQREYDFSGIVSGPSDGLESAAAAVTALLNNLPSVLLSKVRFESRAFAPAREAPRSRPSPLAAR